MKDKNGIEISEVEILKKELCFTDEELDLIRLYLQEPIWEYKDSWSAVKKIISKCDELLKGEKYRDMSISVKVGDDVVKIQDADKSAIKDLEDI